MSRTAATQLAQRATRNLSSRWTSRSTIVSPLLTHRATSQTFNASRCAVSQMSRSISTTRMYRVGLQPDTSNPKPKEAESNETASSSSKVELSEERYNQLSESYLNTLVEQLEELQEQREDVDVEYSAGVLNLSFPPNGNYVLNKQPPNKQIWLSSPITGPKRFDFVMDSEGQDAKQGTGAGDWVYLRDGTVLNDILLKEVGVDMQAAWQPEVDPLK